MRKVALAVAVLALVVGAGAVVLAHRHDGGTTSSGRFPRCGSQPTKAQIAHEVVRVRGALREAIRNYSVQRAPRSSLRKELRRWNAADPTRGPSGLLRHFPCLAA